MTIEDYECPYCHSTVDSKVSDLCDMCVNKFYTGRLDAQNFGE